MAGVTNTNAGLQSQTGSKSVRNPRRASLPTRTSTASEERVDSETEPFAQQASAMDYAFDVWQRSVLFWDTLRQRANNMLEREEAGLPPVLVFRSEMLLDARTFKRPANYALLRIVEVGDKCYEDCVDPSHAPVIVLDPRAGHGPGIGGFKQDSEIGIAFHAGHPVYFASFFPTPCPGQTLADVLAALRRFVDEVRGRHPQHAPVLYGNCQAGWAAALLSASCEGLTGPAVLNGSPLSYWAGEPGANPMRLSGGLLGGTWLAHFLADLDNGRFDGAWLVANFENLKPESAVWDKYANLFVDIDKEQQRFLDFERWWNGFYMLSREEIVAIVENLFIGDKLEEGTFNLGESCTIDLRRIRNPLVIFASYGDNITPPHQALGWLAAVYKTTEALREAGQRIVYLTNPHVGHLGIFVSAAVTRFEHRAILESLGEIEALVPGLYEMKINNPTRDPECRKPQYSVTFEERRVEDLRFNVPREAFERVRNISELNESLYRTFISPWVRAAAAPWTATLFKWVRPMRSSRYLLSEKFSPWMYAFATAAEAIRHNRTPLAEDDPFWQAERTTFARVGRAIEVARLSRDRLEEETFARLYGAGFAAAPAWPSPGSAMAGEAGDPACH